MTPVDLLIETGEELHGPNWVSRIADDLGVSDTTVRYWVNGKMRLRPDHPAIDRLCDQVDLKIARLIALKQKFLNPGEGVVTLASVRSSRRL
jgi:DNA-binding transcriptional regulator YdaS (Cro superfamily)